MYKRQGVNITIPPEKSAELLKKINICFLFAQNYHIAMKYVAPIRKELGIRTVFNILGPLSNPAGANMELMGVFDQALVEPVSYTHLDVYKRQAYSTEKKILDIYKYSDDSFDYRFFDEATGDKLSEANFTNTYNHAEGQIQDLTVSKLSLIHI